MHQFNVLSKNLNVFRHYFLEASAGTGKTFAIEHLVVRLLLEEDQAVFKERLLLNQMLVVTFTRIAARDLKRRIRSCLEATALFLEKSLQEGVAALREAPEYLSKLCEQPRETVLLLQRKVSDALVQFDHATISTIHGFCWRVLQQSGSAACLAAHNPANNDLIVRETIVDAVKTCLHEELSLDELSPAQLRLLARTFQYDDQRLQDALVRAAAGRSVVPPESYAVLLKQFQIAMQRLIAHPQYRSGPIVQDFLLLAPAFKGLLSKKEGGIKRAVVEAVEAFARLFDKTEWHAEDFDRLICDGLIYAESLHPTKRMKKSALPVASEQQADGFLESIQRELGPLVAAARDEHRIFARLVFNCQAAVRERLKSKGLLTPDDLLRRTYQALQDPMLLERIQGHYRVAIIDEFQDTDPLQWSIFKTLFLERKEPGLLYLVGDPKQSIYAFRNADVYTYLEAAEALGEESKAFLDVNYRSHPDLIGALNALFAHSRTPGFLALPKSKSSLACPSVSAGHKREIVFPDGLGRTHFQVVKATSGQRESWPTNEMELQQLFPFVLEELRKISSSVPLEQCAILVRDRYQADRLQEYLKAHAVPSRRLSGASAGDGSVPLALADFLTGILFPHKPTLLRRALLTPLFNWTHLEVQKVAATEGQSEFLKEIERLKKSFLQEGVHGLATALATFRSSAQAPLFLERMDEQVHAQWRALIQHLIEYERTEYASAWQVAAHLVRLAEDGLDYFSHLEEQTHAAGVNVLTLHSCKGLEFDVVFALGLASRTPSVTPWIPQEDGLERTLSVTDLHTEAYLAHCEELDAEKMRQFYVAMTRARQRLYVPVLIDQNQRPVEFGRASPMELFLGRIGQPACGYCEWYERLTKLDEKSLAAHPAITFSIGYTP